MIVLHHLISEANHGFAFESTMFNPMRVSRSWRAAFVQAFPTAWLGVYTKKQGKLAAINSLERFVVAFCAVRVDSSLRRCGREVDWKDESRAETTIVVP